MLKMDPQHDVRFGLRPDSQAASLRLACAATALVAALLSGCVTRPVPISSTLVHGADSVDQLSVHLLKDAATCVGKPVAFWGRYFNHSDIPERLAVRTRASRPEYSFSKTETQAFASADIRLLPIFSQNVNHLDRSAGERHGRINANDLLANVGTRLVIDHLSTRPLYIFLNQEKADQSLTYEYWQGWTAGFAGAINDNGGNAANLRPSLYAQVHGRPDLQDVLRRIRTNRDPFGGLWLVSPDNEVLAWTGRPASVCGGLSAWETALPRLDADVGPILLRQYVLDAKLGFGRHRAPLDLNALNPVSSAAFLDGLLRVNLQSVPPE